MIRFYYINVTDFQHLILHSMPCCPTTEIVLWPVTSLHTVYTAIFYISVSIDSLTHLDCFDSQHI